MYLLSPTAEVWYNVSHLALSMGDAGLAHQVKNSTMFFKIHWRIPTHDECPRPSACASQPTTHTRRHSTTLQYSS